jgi:hypothetical protein
MFEFWDSAVKPLLGVTKAKVVVEVGAETGRHTMLLLRWAADHGAVVHVIEPQPYFDVNALERRYPRSFVMHQGLSLQTLPAVPKPDVVLLDGDHNWYTVIEELRAVDRLDAEWPVVLLHDVDWPYGRRDMYYNPDTVPKAWRQPYKRSGLVRGVSELTRDGINGEYANASYEGGPRNGVLTAVEDFIDETQRALALFLVPGPEGLGILVDPNRVSGRLERLIKQVHDPDFGRALSPRHSSTGFSRVG